MMLRVGDLADENCAHFMWVTAPFLPDGIRLMKVYGFRYVTVGFTWAKTNKKSGTLFWGMGHSTRACSEFCLLGMKGKVKRESASVHSVVMSPIRKHSAKPPEVRDRIVELYGDIPRVELYAREQAPGWTATGLEYDGKDIKDFINEQVPPKALGALSRRT